MAKFIEITNTDIYKEIKDMKAENREQHSKIIEHQLKTNGKVLLNKWLSTTALTIALILLGLFVNSIIK